MKDILLGRYRREDPFAGRGKHVPPMTVTHAYPVEIECLWYDFGEERELGVLVNGSQMQDKFVIRTLNRYGEVAQNMKFNNRISAAEAFVEFTKQNKGFRKVAE